MRLVWLFGNQLFACPNHVPSPQNERQLSTSLGLITQANNENRFNYIQKVNKKHETTTMAVQLSWTRLPHPVIETLFSFLDINELRNCSLVCKNWCKFLHDENNDVWRLHCIRKLADEALKSDVLSDVTTYKAKLRSFYHAWNPTDCSRNVYIKSNAFTLHRNPVAQSTDGARGKIGFRTGRHCWEVWWEGPLGTVAVIGIATKDSLVTESGLCCLVRQRLPELGLESSRQSFAS